MSIGGNDISFSRLAGALFLPGVSLDNTYVRQLLGADLNEKFNSLNQRFSSLNDAIRLLRAKKVFLMSYPDLTHFNSSTYCGLPFTLDAVDIILNLAAEVPLALSDFVCPGDCFDTPVVDYFASRAVCLGKNIWAFLYELVDYIFNLTSVDDLQDVGATFADFFTEVGATRSEFRFAHENIIKRLNSTIQQNCSRYNWKFMANADQMTVNNGICNCNNTYFNTLGKSYIVQNDYKGTAHLNKNGHAAVNKTLVYNQLTNSLLDSNSRKEIIVPTTQGNPSFDITVNPQLKERVNMLQLKDSETELKIREKVSGDRSRLLQRIQSLRPQLEKLKKHFKKRAEEVKP
jgi:hypothetical protein